MEFNTTIKSPNFNERPLPNNIELVVLHYTDTASIEESFNILCSKSSQVSSHYLIDYDGKIFQLVDELKRAWHAGVSSWMGKENVNDFSIGIELQNYGYEHFKKFGYWPCFTENLMESLANILVYLCKKYKLSFSNIVGHCQIAPHRKIDPGPHFNWHYILDALKEFS